MLGIRSKNISVDVIFCVWGQYLYHYFFFFFLLLFFFFLGGGCWLRTKCSCEVPHRLQIMVQSCVTAASPQPLSRMGISIAW